MEWNKKQKIAFVKIQNLLAEEGLTNEEVAEMFSTFENKEQVFTHFQFTTSKSKKLLRRIKKILQDGE
jgi:sialic acid synthase SpsE